MSMLGTDQVCQVGIIVSDIEAKKKEWAKLLGVEVPPTFTGGEFETTQVQYKGAPAPDATCLLVFFNLSNGLQIELIQPSEAPSVWRDYLNEHGDGIHHVAFIVKGLGNKVMTCMQSGMTLEQFGEYGDASGRYAYMNAVPTLGTFIELLENGRKEDLE